MQGMRLRKSFPLPPKFIDVKKYRSVAQWHIRCFLLGDEK
jgi:hypothetical protein